MTSERSTFIMLKLSSFCDAAREHVDAVVSSTNELKISVTVPTGLLHSQPYTKSHFHFFINIKFCQDGADTSVCLEVLI